MLLVMTTQISTEKKSVHSRLKCNLVNFEIPNGFIYKQNGFLLSNTLRTKSPPPPKNCFDGFLVCKHVSAYTTNILKIRI